jgi:hypothetical protein
MPSTVFEIIMSLTKSKYGKNNNKNTHNKGEFLKCMLAMIARRMFLSASPSYMNMQSLISVPFI